MIKLKGHESFIPREGWITKGILAVEKDPFVFRKNNGTDELGVGTNMAKSIRYWLRAMRITEEKGKDGVCLTALGQLIVKHDPYLEDIFTVALLHCKLVCNKEFATTWYIFFQYFERNEFIRDQLREDMVELLQQYVQNDTFKNDSLYDDCTVLVNMYSRERLDDYDPEDNRFSPFSQLGLIQSGRNSFVRKSVDTSKIPAELIYYLLTEQMKMLSKDTLSFDEALQGEGSPGKVLYINRAELNYYLDLLESKRCISVSRTAGLDVITNLRKEDIITNYYRKL